MVKYIKNMTSVVFEEIPNKITLAVNISNCQNNCKGCHSFFLSKDMGDELTTIVIDDLMKRNKGVNCFLFLGEGNDKAALYYLNSYIKGKYHIETAIYSGRDDVEEELYDLFDYVKVGSYQENLGGLNSKTTNQRLYYHLKDITSLFFKK